MFGTKPRPLGPAFAGLYWKDGPPPAIIHKENTGKKHCPGKGWWSDPPHPLIGRASRSALWQPPGGEAAGGVAGEGRVLQLQEAPAEFRCEEGPSGRGGGLGGGHGEREGP